MSTEAGRPKQCLGEYPTSLDGSFLSGSPESSDTRSRFRVGSILKQLPAVVAGVLALVGTLHGVPVLKELKFLIPMQEIPLLDAFDSRASSSSCFPPGRPGTGDDRTEFLRLGRTRYEDVVQCKMVTDRLDYSFSLTLPASSEVVGMSGVFGIDEGRRGRSDDHPGTRVTWRVRYGGRLLCQVEASFGTTGTCEPKGSFGVRGTTLEITQSIEERSGSSGPLFAGIAEPVLKVRP